jgi:signal transduction histidine kinase
VTISRVISAAGGLQTGRHAGVRQVRENVANTAILVCLCLLAPALAGSFLRSTQTGWLDLYSAQLVAATVVAFAWVFRRQLRWELRIGVILIAGLGLGLAENADFGYGSGSVMLCVTCILAVTLFGLRAGLGTLCLCTTTILFTGYLVSTGTLPLVVQKGPYDLTLVAWIDHATGFTLVTGIAVVGFDLLIRSLVRSLIASDEANVQKDRFLTALSHELRTPLTPALLDLGMLRQTIDSGPLREEVIQIEQAIRMEMHLIEDLLQLTAVASRKLTLNLEDADLHKLLHEATDCCRLEVLARGIDLETNLGAHHSMVHADGKKIEHVLWSVLRNAAKFTPEGGRICISTQNSGPCAIVVKVVDSGIGMDRPVLQHLFRLFRHGSDTIARQYGGLGVGMAIAKAILDLHGATIEASSDGQGKGSTFTITMPLKSAMAAEQVDSITTPAA